LATPQKFLTYIDRLPACRSFSEGRATPPNEFTYLTFNRLLARQSSEGAAAGLLPNSVKFQ